MDRPTSQNAATRRSHIEHVRRRRVAVSLAGALTFLAIGSLAVDYVAGSESVRTIDVHLAWLADPRTWLR